MNDVSDNKWCDGMDGTMMMMGLYDKWWVTMSDDEMTMSDGMVRWVIIVVVQPNVDSDWNKWIINDEWWIRW